MSLILIARNANTDAGVLPIGRIAFHDVTPWSLWIGTTVGNKEIGLNDTDRTKLAGIAASADECNFANVAAALNAANASIAVNSQKITGMLDPTSAQDAATKAYVDSVAQGLHPIGDVVAMTTGALAACGYDNGTLGVGATLTETAANGALAAQDGVTLTVNQRLLVKNQAAPEQNGVYQLSTVGDGATKWVLTRVTDMDEKNEIASRFTFVSGGTTGANTGWACTTEPELTTVGTDAITWVQFSAAGQTQAGTGLTKAGNTLSLTLKTNLAASDAPDANDDADAGYAVGSLWIDTTADKTYVCVDSTNDTAVWKETSPTAGSGATTALDNLATVRVNSPLLPATAASQDFGSATLPWKDIWIAGSGANAATINFRITGTPTTTSKVITIPDLTGVVLLDTSTIDGGTWAA